MNMVSIEKTGLIEVFCFNVSINNVLNCLNLNLKSKIDNSLKQIRFKIKLSLSNNLSWFGISP